MSCGCTNKLIVMNRKLDELLRLAKVKSKPKPKRRPK